jgi:hypothetical protein
MPVLMSPMKKSSDEGGPRSYDNVLKVLEPLRRSPKDVARKSLECRRAPSPMRRLPDGRPGAHDHSRVHLMGEPNAELRVGAHVLVQLGSELVTDVEQAILECVKNSYDADSPGCRIDVDTREVGVRIESGPAAKLRRFNKSSETVEVGLYDSCGQRLSATSVVKDDEILRRHLSYTGRITIEDRGDGLTSEQLQDSWLVISRSSKRGEHGVQKSKTAKGRTPLGDKGLGRLGSMKLGDILRIETATAPTASLATAQFRWADCESARTVDEIPVFVEEVANTEKFKGTRVSVLGLRDLSEWRRKDRINEITRSLARLISPFEATSTFPVGITLDGAGHSLVSVTEDVLRRAIAEFSFRWDMDPNKGQRCPPSTPLRQWAVFA